MTIVVKIVIVEFGVVGVQLRGRIRMRANSSRGRRSIGAHHLLLAVGQLRQKQGTIPEIIRLGRVMFGQEVKQPRVEDVHDAGCEYIVVHSRLMFMYWSLVGLVYLDTK